MGKQILTNSRMSCHKSCKKQHFFSYENGLRKKTSAAPLRMGTAFHAGQETLGKGGTIDDAVESARKCYQDRPDFIDEQIWGYEETTVVCLLVGNHWRWQDHKIEHLATEQSFYVPLINPKTGRATPTFDLGGKLDGIVRCPDGRTMVREIKLLGEEIGDDAAVWRRLRMDNQISLYTYAARKLGYEIDAVMYCITRKPSIRPTQVPTLDNEGLKIVVDRQGNRVFNKAAEGKVAKPRQTSDTELGYTLLSRPMTNEEWSDRLMQDIADRPDWYFARKEIARLDCTVDLYMEEVWHVQKDIRACQVNGIWFRSVHKNTCSFCPFISLCEQDWKPGDPVPDDMHIVDDVHQELILAEAT